MIAGEPSRDASSTRISSKSPKSCASTDSIASASQRAPLCTGITIDTRGVAVESSVPVPILTIVLQAANDASNGLYQSRSEEHTSELQSLMRIPYAVFCL